MLSTENFIDSLINCGFEQFAGVPCSNLTPVINYASNLGRYVAAANEGDAAAYAAGAYLAGKRVAVLMQNSGLSNALSPLTSLNAMYEIPVLMLIGHRGGLNDEPQHRLMGEITEDTLKLIGADYKAVSAVDDVKIDIEKLYTRKTSLAYLVKKGDFSAVKLVAEDGGQGARLTRSGVLRAIDEIRDEATAVVTTTGFISREMYDKYGGKNNFYMFGSMGCAISIGNGMARHMPEKKIIVVDGDGSFLMRPSGALLSRETNVSNLIHVIIDNNCYESTGGQASVAGKMDVDSVAAALYKDAGVLRIADNEDGVYEVLKYYIENIDAVKGVKCLVCKVKTDGENKLGRPKETCPELLEKFKKGIGSV